ncbi:MAG: hypothetical protein VYD05_05570 [Planctomycetota bacterium]|nr:hypothetical protein [Planctomycetota bacterium]
MDAASVTLKTLRERVLKGGGDLSLALLLEHLAPLAGLRELAVDFGVSPKGGFRIERAPARVLATKLAEERDPARLERVLRLIVTPPEVEGQGDPPAVAADQAAQAAAQEARALLALRDQEAQSLREQLERAREGAVRSQRRERDLERQLRAAQEEAARVGRSAEDATRAAVEAKPVPREDKALELRVRELEAERESMMAADEAARRLSARDRSRVRELEDEVAELESLIPASRRRKKNPLPPALPDERVFRVPHLHPSFYKSLESKERRSIERAWQALLLFCTEGHGYPGLEVKQIKGQDTWSMRASLGLRIYFRQRDDGDIDVLELGDREDQHTTLRRLKER